MHVNTRWPTTHPTRVHTKTRAAEVLGHRAEDLELLPHPERAESHTLVSVFPGAMVSRRRLLPQTRGRTEHGTGCLMA